MGSLTGVVATRAAWVGALEVVEVAFRPSVLSYAALLDHAIASHCDQAVFATSDAQLALARERVGAKAERLARDPRVAKDSDQLYYLLQSPLRFLPLTPAQARQVNSALASKQAGGAKSAQADALAFLSPRQAALAERVRRALQEDPAALDGLEHPTGEGALARLDEYAAALLARLP